MINTEKTLEKFGYKPCNLAPNSKNLIVHSCDKCGSERDYTYAYALKKEQTSGNCQKCQHSHRKGVITVKKREQATVELPPEVDVLATMEQFGYDPRKLAPWSRQRIVVRCYETGKAYTPKRCGLNRNKSIIETGHFISLGAWTAKRRKGIKASAETKEKQALSQNKRRQLEKQVKTLSKVA